MTPWEDRLKASEKKTLSYLRKMFEEYTWIKTAGGGFPDFIGYFPADSDLPMLFVESKCGSDRLRDTQKDFANSQFGLRASDDNALWVIYMSDDSDTTPCFAYSWNVYMQFVEGEGLIAREERKTEEMKARTSYERHDSEVFDAYQKGEKSYDELEVYFWPELKTLEGVSSRFRSVSARAAGTSWLQERS